MTSKRRYLISVAILAACACIALNVLPLMLQGSGVSKANFNRIGVGMTRAEVDAILGESFADDDFGVRWFHADGSAVVIHFVGGNVLFKDFHPSVEAFPDKIRRWLGIRRQPTPIRQ